VKNVKLLIDLLIGEMNHAAEAIVSIPDARADQLIRLGHAEAAEDGAPVANPDQSQVADLITPEPPAEAPPSLTMAPARPAKGKPPAAAAPASTPPVATASPATPAPAQPAWGTVAK
jgi:hypothetical protein